MAVCCLPGLSLLTARLPALRGRCRSPVPGRLPGAPLCVGMGALLRKAVGTLWEQAKGVRVRCRRDSTPCLDNLWGPRAATGLGLGAESPRRFRNGVHEWLTLPGCLLWVWPRDWGMGRQPCGFCSALLGDFRGLFTVGWLGKVMGDPTASIPISVQCTSSIGGSV